MARDTDELSLNLNVGERVYITIAPEKVMGFEMDEIDSAPIL